MTRVWVWCCLFSFVCLVAAQGDGYTTCDQMLLTDINVNPIRTEFEGADDVIMAKMVDGPFSGVGQSVLIRFRILAAFKEKLRDHVSSGTEILVEIRNDNISLWRDHADSMNQTFILFLKDTFWSSNHANFSIDACGASWEQKRAYWLNDCVQNWLNTKTWNVCPCVEAVHGDHINHNPGNYTTATCNNKCVCYINGVANCTTIQCGLTAQQRTTRRIIALIIVVVLGIIFVVSVTIHQVRHHRHMVRKAVPPVPKDEAEDPATIETVSLEDH